MVSVYAELCAPFLYLSLSLSLTFFFCGTGTRTEQALFWPVWFFF